MTALTSEEYGKQKLDLVRAIELAEGEVHSIAFKVSTGAVEEADQFERAATESSFKKRDPEGYAEMAGHVARQMGVEAAYIAADGSSPYPLSPN